MAYVRFAVAHPEHYRLALLDPCPKPNPQVDEVIASSAFAHFQHDRAGLHRHRHLRRRNPLAITFDLWAAAHGVAGLLIAEAATSPSATVDEFADRVLCAAALGHATRQLLGGDPDARPGPGWLDRQRGGEPAR